MKPIHLNLASRPYRDYRPVYATVVVMSLLAAFLMLQNVDTYVRYTHETRNTRAKIAAVEAETARERQREQAVQAQLKGLDLVRLDAQTKFVNAKLQERAFSWSTLLDQLESVLADDVRLMSVAPSFREDGTIALALDLRSKAGDGMTRTINRMNADPQFSNPFPSGESMTPEGYAFDLQVEYLPPPVGGGVELTEARR